MASVKSRRIQSRALPWFGADTMVCDKYAALLSECKHVTIPFCGGLSIVRCLIEQGVSEIVCNDKHRLSVNFYRCLCDTESRKDLIECLGRVPFHEDVLFSSQEMCKSHEIVETLNVKMAFHYFVTAWMGRSGKAGTDSEFNGGLAMRWDAGGGSSPLRFQTAVRSIEQVWRPVCERCSFLCRDWEEIVGKVKDAEDCGIYADPPWVGAGDQYVHKFVEKDHSKLCRVLSSKFGTKIVVRYGDDPLIRSLYKDWDIKRLASRDQANGDVGELCITNFDQRD